MTNNAGISNDDAAEAIAPPTQIGEVAQPRRRLTWGRMVPHGRAAIFGGEEPSSHQRTSFAVQTPATVGCPWLFGVLMLVLMGSLLGCSMTRPNLNDAPIVFTSPPDLAQIVSAVNENTDRVRQLHSNSVRLTMPGVLMGLSGTVDLDRMTGAGSPGRFRLSGTALGTRQLDLGSNDEEYWMWVRERKPPTVFWGRHQDFYQSAAQDFLPMPPSWLIDALGVVQLDSRDQHDGPYGSTTPGLLQLRTRIPTPKGEMLRVLEIDQQRALIVRQQIFDAGGRLLAIADSSDFRHDLVSQATLPHTIRVNLPPAGLEFDFKVDQYVINQPVADPDEHWAVPKIPEHRYLNLADPNDMRGVRLMGAAPSDFYDRAQVSPQPATAESTPRAAWRRFPPFSVFR